MWQLKEAIVKLRTDEQKSSQAGMADKCAQKHEVQQLDRVINVKMAVMKRKRVYLPEEVLLAER